VLNPAAFVVDRPAVARHGKELFRPFNVTGTKHAAPRRTARLDQDRGQPAAAHSIDHSPGSPGHHVQFDDSLRSFEIPTARCSRCSARPSHAGVGRHRSGRDHVGPDRGPGQALAAIEVGSDMPGSSSSALVVESVPAG